VATHAIKKVHMVGIGGIGVSALARLFAAQGVFVTGSDQSPVTTKHIQAIGIPVSVGPYRAKNVPKDADLVVFTNDVLRNNPELTQARTLGIKTLSYPEALPLALGKQHIIGVSGTHGKTTTTGMIGMILLEAGWDPTIVIGSLFTPINGNARLGKGRYAVVEADEYKRAFHNYPSQVAVVTNVEEDHLNYYRDLDEIQQSFRKFLSLVPRSGLTVSCGDDVGAREVTSHLACCALWYGIEEHNDLRAIHVQLDGPETHFQVSYLGKPFASFSLRVPGLHNVRNALAAIAVTSHLGVPLEHIQKALKEFPGARRRFEFVGEGRGISIIDDYAHHPTELAATLRAARSRFGRRRLIAIFQPHTYTRLRDFFKGFVDALTLADLVIIPPTHGVAERENIAEISKTYTSETLAGAVKRKKTEAIAVPTFEAALAATTALMKKGDVILTIGAGRVTDLAPKLLAVLKK
jgi:UDP-N-acetylmuramate--alanine ligase